MENYLDNIEDKDAFIQGIKDSLDQAAYVELEAIKKQMAQDFLTNEEE